MRLLFISFLAFALLIHNALAAKQHASQKNPSALVVGTVYCETCFHREFSKTGHFISGASVVVQCLDGSGGEKPSFHKEAKTNKHGEFTVHLPFLVGKHVRRIKKCSVRLLSSNEPYCSVASKATSSSLRLTSTKQGNHIFSAGFFTFKPHNQPFLCNNKPSSSPSINSEEAFLPYPKLPSFPHLNPKPPSFHLPLFPPIPHLPTIPKLPSIPNVGILPKKPSKTSLNEKTEQPAAFYPPFLPRPTTPGVPSSPSIPLQPEPPSINLPPNPPIAPPPAFQFPFPPFPFPPGSSGFPGFPPLHPGSSGSPGVSPFPPGSSGFPGVPPGFPPGSSGFPGVPPGFPPGSSGFPGLPPFPPAGSSGLPASPPAGSSGLPASPPAARSKKTSP